MMLPGLGITWEWTRWLLRNPGHGIFFRPIAGLVHVFSYFLHSPTAHTVGCMLSPGRD
jgi:hypothetical protein